MLLFAHLLTSNVNPHRLLSWWCRSNPVFAVGLLLVSICVVSRAEPPATPAAPVATLTADPAIRFGQLPNGLRYAVRANAEPKGRASLRLVVCSGSFMETEAQRGLAHFLEHMAFNGSEHFPANTLVETLQRFGMSFGGDTNAFTSYDRTVYQLELPDTKSETVDEGFRIFADYAGGLLLQTKEIDDERGIILSEKRTRDSVGFRTMVAEMKFALDGTLLPERLPIGLEDIIRTAPREAFVDLYNTWYRPERMAVIAVGDFDPATVEEQLKTALAGVKDRAPARPEPKLGSVPTGDGLRMAIHSEPEAPATSVSISSVVPQGHVRDTVVNRIRDLKRAIAITMLNRRLSVRAKEEGAPFSGARASYGDQFDLFREASIEATSRPEQWKAALGVIEQELRGALEYGFQPAELREAVANYREALEQAVRQAPTRRSTQLASDLVDTFVEGTVFTTPATDRDLFVPVLETLTPADCLAALRDLWSAPSRDVFLSGNVQVDGDAEAVIKDAYRASRAIEVKAPAEQAEAVFGYTDFGPAGQVIRRRHIDDLDLTLVEFANGVRLNLKKTDFEAHRIGLLARVGSGQLTEPRDEPGLGVIAESTFTAGGLGKHSVDDLKRILAGEPVGTSFSVGSDAFVFSGGTDAEHFPRECQLVAAYLSDPGYRPEAFRQVTKGINQFYTGLEHSIDGPFRREVPRILASGDSRFGLPDRNVLLGYAAENVKAWLTPQLAAGPLKVAVVGDLDPNAVIAAVARTFGALPPRSARPDFTKEREVRFPAQGLEREFRVETEIPKGVVGCYWPTTDASDVHVARRLSLLADVFQDRLRVKVREQIGGTYSPSAGSSTSDTYKDYGYIVAQMTVEPARAGAIVTAVREIAGDLAKEGVTTDELERARKPLLTQLRESVRTNRYWLGNVLARAQEKPEVLDWARSREADFESISKAELDRLAALYFRADRLCTFVSLPAETAKPAATAAAPVTAEPAP